MEYKNLAIALKAIESINCLNRIDELEALLESFETFLMDFDIEYEEEYQDEAYDEGEIREVLHYVFESDLCDLDYNTESKDLTKSIHFDNDLFINVIDAWIDRKFINLINGLPF